MIIFDLACEHGHTFEGWFNSSADYDEQLRKGLLSCARCGSTAIRRVPSAPHLSSSPSRAPETMPSDTKDIAGNAAPKPAATLPAGIEQAYQQLMTAVLAGCEDVGNQFADEARKIHYMEAPARAIRGQASDDDYEALRDEGIDVVRLPVVSKH